MSIVDSTVSRPIKIGDKGPAVVAIQVALKQDGYDIEVTGEFDADTEDLVKDFQEDSGLKVTGEVDPLTADELDNIAVPLSPEDFVGRIIRAAVSLGYRVIDGVDRVNICYIEGINADGVPNDNAPNTFNDLRTVIRVVGGKAEFLGRWEGTTEPGRYWTEHPMNPQGAARIAFGSHKAWQVGIHHDHEALVQTGGPVTVHRDLNQDYSRANDKIFTGMFGVNQHWGYDMQKSDLGRSSAGCLVGRAKDGHREFMRILKTDGAFRADNKFVFSTVVLPASAIQ